MTLNKVRTGHEVQRRCDDSCDDSNVSPFSAKSTVLKGIEKFTPIVAICLQMLIRKGEDDKAQIFSFSRNFTAPQTIMHITSVKLALLNVTFLFADNELVFEDVLIGLPVLQHLRVDTHTLLELNRAALNGIDCSEVDNICTDELARNISLMVLCCLNLATNKLPAKYHCQEDERRPFVHYYAVRTERDPFPHPSLLDPIDREPIHLGCDRQDEVIRTHKRTIGLAGSEY